jgi:hypothetical protein
MTNYYSPKTDFAPIILSRPILIARISIGVATPEAATGTA